MERGGTARNFGRISLGGGGGAAAHVSAESAKPSVSQHREKRYSADIRGGRRVRRPPPPNPPLLAV